MDETLEGEIPNTPYSELPATYNEMSERRRVAEALLDERINNCMFHFYREMNDTACKYGMKKSHFSSVHGMNNYSNYSSALDIAKLSRIALSQYELLAEIVNTKEYSLKSRINRNFDYNWKNTNMMLWQQD